MGDGKIDAVWVGPFEGLLPDGTVVRPGDTARIPEGEAKASDFWRPAAATDPPSKPSKPASKDGGDG